MDAIGPVAAAVERLRAGLDRPVVVALDGHSTAGKTTLAAALAERLDAAVVHGDDFYRDIPEVERLSLTASEGVDRYFDWQRLRDEALVVLRDRRTARFARFDWDRGGGLVDTVVVEPRDVVVVEGVYSARPELAHLVDLSVLVQAPPATRRRRRRERHDPLDWEARWDAAEVLYFAEVRRLPDFDLVVAGDR